MGSDDHRRDFRLLARALAHIFWNTKGAQMNLTIKPVETSMRRFACCICGAATDKNLVQAAAFDQDGDKQGCVCRACLESKETLIARAHEHAIELRASADA